MKRAIPHLKFGCIVLFCSGLMLTCRKSDTTPDEPANPAPPDTTAAIGSVNADTIANHLQFFNAVKKGGSIPQGPSGSTLKISFKDTLYLTDELTQPIKFLHEDTTQNVAGMYVQVHQGMSGGASSFYYDVPEEPLMDDNDTVSLIFVGINPDDLRDSGIGVPPAGAPLVFDITITPYDAGGRPLATETMPVLVSSPETGGGGGSTGACSLVGDVGEYWDWDASFMVDKTGPVWENNPSKVWGGLGQTIRGSCCNGNSVYGVCAGDTAANSSLHFNTYFQFPFERLTFFPNNTFQRASFEIHSIPDPPASDFCGGGEGVVSLKHYAYQKSGTYTVTKITLPARFPESWRKNDTLLLTLKHTSGTTGGAGNAGGVIHQLDCKIGALVLMDLDREGGESDLYKFYSRRSIDEPRWYPFG